MINNTNNEAISWEDFEKVKLQVGTILEAKDFPKAKKQLRLII